MKTDYAVPSYSGPSNVEINGPVERRVERRRHRRYIVRGRVRFLADSLEVWGELINFSSGGMQVRTSFELAPDARLTLRVMPFCSPGSFEVAGRIVGGAASLVSIQFVSQPKAVDELLRWLEREHFPWTGGPDGPLTDDSGRAVGMKVPESESVQELVYQLA